MKIYCALLFVAGMHPLVGQPSSQSEIEGYVEKFRLALIDPTQRNLSDLTSDQLSFGHSSGKIENKTEFIEALVSGKSNFNSIEFKDQIITISNATALVRHKLFAEITDGEKISTIAIGVLLVWVKEEGKWKLLGRQAFKLP
ncbi:MAG: nuclear transport factor 2 family protein [Cyclobacteriaceae bacterium]|nr:nuclear transport factor 2 family protein [Cyclobacteriaceae bacterium]